MLELHYDFPNRKSGSFGTSAIGRFFEWWTTTWKRFTVLIFSVIIAVLLGISPELGPERFIIIVFSPLAGLLYWYIFSIILLFSRHLGILGFIIAHILIIYYAIFSRVVVQKAPILDLPVSE